jgi:GT2 family glycosyltransferase
VLVRAAAIRQAGGLDEVVWTYGDEIEWDYRLEKAGWKRVFVPVDSIIHLQREAGYEYGSRSHLLQARNLAYFYHKNRMPGSFSAYCAAALSLGAMRWARACVARGDTARQRGYVQSLAQCYWLIARGNCSSPKYGFGHAAAAQLAGAKPTGRDQGPRVSRIDANGKGNEWVGKELKRN